MFKLCDWCSDFAAVTTKVDNVQDLREQSRLGEGRCIIMGTPNPDVCDIVTCSPSSQESYRDPIARMFSKVIEDLFPAERERDDPIYFRQPNDEPSKEAEHEDGDSDVGSLSYSSILGKDCSAFFVSEVDLNDQAWNKLPLEPQLLRWWREGYFALKPISIDPQDDSEDCQGDRYCRIKLQFYWMLRKKNGTEKAPPLNTRASQVYDALCSLPGKTYGDEDTGNPPFCERTSPAQTAKTGDIFYFNVKAQHANKAFLAFKLRWKITNILALAGGTESLEDVGPCPKYLDEWLDWPAFPATKLMRKCYADSEEDGESQ